jgi:hypothetical protein
MEVGVVIEERGRHPDEHGAVGEAIAGGGVRQIGHDGNLSVSIRR